MPRLIDAEEAKRLFSLQTQKGKKCHTVSLLEPMTEFLQKVIDRTPTVDPVHAAGGICCRECGLMAEHNMTCKRDGTGVYGHDFCSRGIRREPACADKEDNQHEADLV